MIDGCLNWYDYLADKNEDLESLLKEKLQSRNIVTKNFVFGIVNDNSILAAKENIKNKDPHIASIALMYSLKYDLELRGYILDRVSFQDENYFSNYSMQIAAMYNCEISRDCGPDSDSNLGSCLANENFCGLSVYDIMNNLYSPSQIIEMQNILGIIMQKINLEGG